ncbi:MAG: hypothetical protein HYS08_02980 [Chlamydiae bacterium]|nr:hypothetical protein [Chlamydiota bacterium]
MLNGSIRLNGEETQPQAYSSYHRRRVEWTLEQLHRIKASKILEVGAHPWVMTAAFVDTPGLEMCATISAEELTHWPDEIGVQVRPYHIKTTKGNEARFNNYSVNVERTLF